MYPSFAEQKLESFLCEVSKTQVPEDTCRDPVNTGAHSQTLHTLRKGVSAAILKKRAAVGLMLTDLFSRVRVRGSNRTGSTQWIFVRATI